MSWRWNFGFPVEPWRILKYWLFFGFECSYALGFLGSVYFICPSRLVLFRVLYDIMSCALTLSVTTIFYLALNVTLLN